MTKQEARAYKEEREVVAVRRLIEAFQHNDVAAFERILQVLRVLRVCVTVCMCVCRSMCMCVCISLCV